MLLLSGGGSQLVIKVLKDEDLQGREEQTQKRQQDPGMGSPEPLDPFHSTCLIKS